MSATQTFRRAALAALLAAGVACGAETLGSRARGLAQKLRSAQSRMTRRAVCSDAALARAALAVDKANLLLRRYFSSSVRDMLVRRELDVVAAYLRNPEAPALKNVRGFHEMAYISDIDLSPQPYALYVPSVYDGARPLPAIVFLHGYAADLNKVNWIEYMYSPSLQEVCEKLGFALILPYGRSNTEFMGVGESDVLRVIELVKGRVRIDPSRIVISGASMGGSGAYSIACHFPDRFAGVFTVTGRVDYYVWMKIPKSRLPVFKQIQTDTDYARELLGNLLHVPVFIGHGENDNLLKVGQSRLMARLLKERGQDVKYVEFPGESHYVWSKTFERSELQSRLKKWRAPKLPAKVQYRTYTLKYHQAYWVNIDAIETWGLPADVKAEVKGPTRIEARVTNVGALTLRPGKLVAPGRDVEVSVNGKVRRARPDASGAMRLQLSPTAPAGALRKTPRLCGPIREVYDGPFLIVAPTVKGKRLNRDLATTRRIALEWMAYAQGRAPMKADKDITAADIASFNLILCGGPETNLMVKRVNGKLPVRIEKGAYAVGKRRFARAGAGLMLIYPNPLNPKRYVMIHDGAQWGGALSSNHKLEFLPDFIVFAAGVERDGTYFETNPYVCAGYFDAYWRLSDKSLWVRPLPGALLKTRPDAKVN